MQRAARTASSSVREKVKARRYPGSAAHRASPQERADHRQDQHGNDQCPAGRSWRQCQCLEDRKALYLVAAGLSRNEPKRWQGPIGQQRQDHQSLVDGATDRGTNRVEIQIRSSRLLPPQAIASGTGESEQRCAHKLARMIYFTLKPQRPYVDHGTSVTAQAPRNHPEDHAETRTTARLHPRQGRIKRSAASDSLAVSRLGMIFVA